MHIVIKINMMTSLAHKINFFSFIMIFTLLKFIYYFYNFKNKGLVISNSDLDLTISGFESLNRADTIQKL